MPRSRDLPGSRIGVPAQECPSDDQSASFKELVNKLAWAVGSSYRVPYSNYRTSARSHAVELAGRMIQSAGYPRP